jgi:phosphatidylglycerophosphate synthase
LQEAVRSTENRIFRSAYKGLTDLVTKWIWPLPAREVTRLLARRGVRPNAVTAWSYLLTVLALLLFARGDFALGLVCGWGMTFLDTVDGKLARCTLTSSRIGHVLDHGLDLVHPPFWWIAFAMGVGLTQPGVELAMWVTVVGYLLGRGLEGLFMLAFQMEIFLWRPFDGFFRTIIARRNPNLLLLTIGVAASRPDLGFFAVAAWTAICNVVHVVRLAQAAAARRRGEAVHSWYDELTEKAA